MRFSSIIGVGVTVAAVAFGPTPAGALEALKDEKERLKACEQKLCRLVTRKTPDKGNFTCALAKTWARDTIKQGSSTGSVSWVFGDARCTVDLVLDNAMIVEALKGAEYTLQFPEHTVSCVIEREKEMTPVTLKAAPKIRFKDGRARKIWVNLKDVEAPSAMRGLALSVAKLEDSVGLFHKPLVKAVNYMIEEKCPKVAAGG
jgi:hypothetical protein